MLAVRPFALIFASCGVFLVGLGFAPRDLRPTRDPSGETARVRDHLEGAESMLLSRDVSTLTAAQRGARAHRVVDLRVYRQRGVFPHNHNLVDGRTPVFIDEHGTRCAMAYLIEQSGDRTLVSRIARTRNLARIRDLSEDNELVAWLDRNGLTLAEAARIQPQYGETPRETGTSGGRWVATAAGLGIGATGTVLNLSIGKSQKARNTRGAVGVACGLLAAGLGLAVLSDDGDVRALGALDIGMGIVSFGFGIGQVNAKGESVSHAASPEVAPMMWCDRGGRRVGLTMRF